MSYAYRKEAWIIWTCSRNLILRLRGFYQAILQFLLPFMGIANFTSCIIYTSSTVFHQKQWTNIDNIFTTLYEPHIHSYHAYRKKFWWEILISLSKFTQSKNVTAFMGACCINEKTLITHQSFYPSNIWRVSICQYFPYQKYPALYYQTFPTITQWYFIVAITDNEST